MSVLDSPNGKRVLRFVQELMVQLQGAAFVVKLGIDDPGEEGLRQHCRDFLVTAETPADRSAMEILYEAQEQSDGAGAGSHRFRLQAYVGESPKPVRATSMTVESENTGEDVRRQGGASSLLEQAYRRIDQDQKHLNSTLGTALHAMTMVVDRLVTRLDQHEANAASSTRLAYEVTKGRAELEVDVETRKALLRAMEKFGTAMEPIVAAKIMKMIAADAPVEDAIVEEEKSELPEPVVTTPVLPAIAATPVKNGHNKKRRRE